LLPTAGSVKEPPVAVLDQVNIVLESNFPVMHFEYVRMGMGVALSPLPPVAALPEQARHSGVTLRNVAHLFGEETLYYIRRKGEFETAYTAKFRDLVLTRQAQRLHSKPV
jgi:DNA-binding transcriptional LysR family regulator